jgi:hypothetical protein
VHIEQRLSHGAYFKSSSGPASQEQNYRRWAQAPVGDDEEALGRTAKEVVQSCLTLCSEFGTKPTFLCATTQFARQPKWFVAQGVSA